MSEKLGESGELATRVAFMVAADRASLIPANPIAADRLKQLTPGSSVTVELIRPKTGD